ncbi:MAG: hypothetical protein WD708_12905 [Kiritimatiellia bacterium]
MNKHRQMDEALKQWGRNVDRDLAHILPGPESVRIPVADVEPERGFNWQPRLAALAACVVILTLAALVILPRRVFTEPGNGMAALADMYAEVTRMFPDQSVWMSTGGDDLEMGMSSLEKTESGTRLVLRVELQRRSGTGGWTDVWRRDILTAESAWVDTVSPDHPEEKLSVWAYSPSKGVWMLESHLELPEPYRVNMREQVMLYTSGNDPALRELPLGPGLRLVQQVLEIDSGRNGA